MLSHHCNPLSFPQLTSLLLLYQPLLSKSSLLSLTVKVPPSQAWPLFYKTHHKPLKNLPAKQRDPTLISLKPGIALGTFLPDLSLQLAACPKCFPKTGLANTSHRPWGFVSLLPFSRGQRRSDAAQCCLCVVSRTTLPLKYFYCLVVSFIWGAVSCNPKLLVHTVFMGAPVLHLAQAILWALF